MVCVRQVTDDAYVRGDITALSAHIEGYVRRVPVDDFQRVKEGELVVEIEDDDHRARVARAEADLQAAKAEARGIEAEARSRRWKLQTIDGHPGQSATAGRNAAQGMRPPELRWTLRNGCAVSGWTNICPRSAPTISTGRACAA